MFKRSQKETSESSKHWYQDKYQHVLTQRNVLALIAMLALSTSIVAVFGILRLAPLKSVEPYLLQIDEKTGITQEALALADRIAVMEAGVLQQFATPQALKDRPANLFVASFIGEPPMNIFAARIARDGGSLRLTALTEDGADAFSLSLPGAEAGSQLAATLGGRGTVRLGNGWLLGLPDMAADTRLPITVEARRLEGD